MAVKVGINGFGRIGRLVFRAMMERAERFEIMAINDLSDAKTLGHLLKYDSSQGRYPGTVEVKDNMLVVDGKMVRVCAERDPGNLPWKELGVDVALESTGVFRAPKTDKKPGFDSHIDAGAKRVVLSAPAKSGKAEMVVLGVNEDKLTADDIVVSNASCTTNSMAPVVKVLDEAFDMEHGLMVTCHGYTADQRIVDLLHTDLRRARAAAVNIIPTTTGAAKAVGKVYPKMAGKLDGYALRVPVPTGSITDLTAVFNNKVTADDINNAVKKAAEGSMKGIIEYTDEPLVSSDIVHNAHSSIFDSGNTKVMGDNLVKMTMWYDNEWGYSCRTADMIEKLAKL